MDQELTRNTSLVLSAARRILRPLTRLLLANGVTLPAIQEILKSVLIEVAEEDFPVKGKVTTDSRISVLTGVHRKDVKRLRHQVIPEMITPKAVSLGSQVINTWISARKWLDKNKQPLPLPRQSARKGLKSFETLVESVSKDVRPRALLDELLRSGLVEVRDDIVHLKTSAFVPKDNFEDTLYYLERGVTSHLDAAVSNVAFNGQPAYFDRMVHYDTIEADKISQLVSSVDTEGMKLLKHINTQAKNSSNKKSERPHSFTLGVYVFHEPVRQNKQGDS